MRYYYDYSFPIGNLTIEEKFNPKRVKMFSTYAFNS